MPSTAKLRMEALGKAFEAARPAIEEPHADAPVLNNAPTSRILREKAKDILSEEAGNLQSATKKLEALIWRDRNLRDTLIEGFVRTACYNLLRELLDHGRRTAWSGSVTRGGGASSTSRVIALGRGTASALFEFLLPGGKSLRDATGAEVSSAADYYEERSTDSRMKSVWLRLIAQSLQPSQKASEVLTEERLVELQVEAARNVKS